MPQSIEKSAELLHIIDLQFWRAVCGGQWKEAALKANELEHQCHVLAIESRADEAGVVFNNTMNEQLPMAPPGSPPATGSAYPVPTPDSVKSALMPGAKIIAREIGQCSRQLGLVVTGEVLQLISAGILGASSSAAHTVLHDREALLADPAVRAWADAPNNEVSEPARPGQTKGKHDE